MDDRAAFISAICERPDDDLPRLLYADYLDDRGEHDYAEFVRVQCELVSCERALYGDTGGYESRYAALSSRERALLKENWRDWTPDLLHAGEHRAGLNWGPAEVIAQTSEEYDSNERRSCEFRRGFLHTIRCTAAAWMRPVQNGAGNWQVVPGRTSSDRDGLMTVGQSILAQHPAERVVLEAWGAVLRIEPSGGSWWLHLDMIDSVSSRHNWFDTRTDLIEAMPSQLRGWGLGGNSIFIPGAYIYDANEHQLAELTNPLPMLIDPEIMRAISPEPIRVSFPSRSREP